MSLILTLPYALEEDERGKPFTDEMEIAAILCLAESRRRKPKLLSTPEKISFISKLFYPIWAYPYNERCIIIDGLGLSTHTLIHRSLPDVLNFTEDLKRSSVDLDLYRNTLKKHSVTFRDFASSKQIRIEAVIGNKRTLSAIAELINERIISKKPLSETAALIPPRIDGEMIAEKAKEIVRIRNPLHSDVKGLEYASEVLKKEMQHHKEMIQREIKEVYESYERRVSKIRPEVEKRIKQLTAEQKKKIAKSFKDQEKRLRAVLREQEKLERTMRKFEASLEGLYKRRESLRRKDKKRDTTYWDNKIAAYRERIKQTSNRIEVISSIAEEIRKDGENRIQGIREAYQEMITKEKEKITLLFSSRDLEIAEKKKVIDEIEAKSYLIDTQIKRLLEEKSLNLAALKELTIPWKVEDITLIRVPFFLVRYETPKSERNETYPLVTASSYEGLLKRIQRAVLSFSLESKIRLLLRSRSKVLEEEFFSVFEEKLSKDIALKEIVYQAARSYDLLKSPNLNEKLMKGLDALKDEGWINIDEKNVILKKYVH